MADKNTKADKGNSTPPASKKIDWQARKLENAKRDDTSVVFCRARDTGDFINILNSNDNLVYQMRMNMGRRESLTFEVVKSYIDRSRRIKEELNLMNAEMCQLLDYTYKPPRGFDHPLKKQEKQTVPGVETGKK